MKDGKIKFIPDAWVKCIYEGNICLGRTFFGKTAANNTPEMVSLVLNLLKPKL